MTGMLSPLRLIERARAGEKGFTLAGAILEALGAASVCWDEDRVFMPERAIAIGSDLEQAVVVFVERAIVDKNLADGMQAWEMTELIFQAEMMGYDIVEDAS